MYIKKKKGSVLIETIVFLMIILVIFSASSKIFVSNIEKIEYLYSREDIKTISYLEYKFLQEFNKFILDNKEDYLKTKEEFKDKKTNVEVYKNANYKNYAVVYNNKKFYITHKKNNSLKYIGISENLENELIYFKTNTYKTDYIIS